MLSRVHSKHGQQKRPGPCYVSLPRERGRGKGGGTKWRVIVGFPWIKPLCISKYSTPWNVLLWGTAVILLPCIPTSSIVLFLLSGKPLLGYRLHVPWFDMGLDTSHNTNMQIRLSIDVQQRPSWPVLLPRKIQDINCWEMPSIGETLNRHHYPIR